MLDARRTIDWLVAQGYERIGILGTSLGSCLSMLTMAHDPRIRAGAFNHISPYFADVVWRGLSTAHVRAGLEGHITLDELRRCWMPISPWPFIERVRGRGVLLVYARYDLTFPVDLSKQLRRRSSRDAASRTSLGVLPCGHYTTGKSAVQVSRRVLLDEILSQEAVGRQVRPDVGTTGPRNLHAHQLLWFSSQRSWPAIARSRDLSYQTYRSYQSYD